MTSNEKNLYEYINKVRDLVIFIGHDLVRQEESMRKTISSIHQSLASLHESMAFCLEMLEDLRAGKTPSFKNIKVVLDEMGETLKESNSDIQKLERTIHKNRLDYEQLYGEVQDISKKVH